MSSTGKGEVAAATYNQLDLEFDISTKNTHVQNEATTSDTDKVATDFDCSTNDNVTYTRFLQEYKITQSDNCCYAVLRYLSNYDLPDEALHDLIVWRSHDYANILIDLADGLFNVFGSSFEHIKTTTWKITLSDGTLDEAFFYHTVNIID